MFILCTIFRSGMRKIVDRTSVDVPLRYLPCEIRKSWKTSVSIVRSRARICVPSHCQVKYVTLLTGYTGTGCLPATWWFVFNSFLYLGPVVWAVTKRILDRQWVGAQARTSGPIILTELSRVSLSLPGKCRNSVFSKAAIFPILSPIILQPEQKHKQAVLMK